MAAGNHQVAASLGLMHKTLGPARADAQKKSGRAEEQDRPDVAEQRADWRAKQSEMSPARLVFVDETGAATNMARRYGRSPRGQRLDGPVPHGHWKSTTFVGGLTTRGFIAPYVLDGAMNGAVFKAWVEQMLAPELRPGDIVVMDNLAAHKVDGIAQAITDRRCRAALPAALLARPQPDRASLRQAQGALAQGRRAHRRRPVERHRPAARSVPAGRVRQLPRQLRLSTLSVKML